MSAPVPVPAARPSARILVVDDAEMNVRLLEGILRRGGYTEIVSLTNPARFDDELRTFGPDIVLLDLHMPELDGFELLARIAAERGDSYLPVLVLTGDATPTARDRALGAGAQDFVTKPFDATEVLLRVRNLLETRFLYRGLEERAGSLAGDVARSEAALAGLFGRLERLSNTHDLAELAAAICREVVAGPPFIASAVLSLPGGALGSIVAAEGRMMDDSLRTAPLPAGFAHALTEKANAGPWLEEWTTGSADNFDPQIEAMGVQSAAYVPLRDKGRVVGVIGAGLPMSVTQAEASQALPVLVEHAAVAQALVVPALVAHHREATLRAELDIVFRDATFSPVFQPVVDLESRFIIGAEALTRFTDGTPPNLRFEAAETVGVGLRLEAATLRASVAASAALPPAAWLSLNVSPALIMSGDVLASIIALTSRPIVLEITEHSPVADYAALRAAIDELRPQVRLAIDDAGAGFASFRHILELRPDFVKLDIGLVRGINADPARQALVAGMRYFATKTGCTLLAEGIETEDEAAMLRSLAVRIGQGYLLGRPAALPWPGPSTAERAAMAAAAATRRPVSPATGRPLPASRMERETSQ